MPDNQKGQSSQGSSGQSSGSGSQSKGAPANPPAAPLNQRSNVRNDGADDSNATKG
jgi:hypothetical protein